MATSQLTGVNYSLDGDTINFFGAKGTKLGNGKWAINAIANAMFEVDPDSIMGKVHDCINGDVENGNGDKIAQLQLGARQAVVFYLEGRLTRTQLADSTEGPDFVDIPSVDIDGRTVTVRVLANPEYDVATADAEGNVL